VAISTIQIKGNVRMLREYALVRHIPAIERKVGNIILPATAQEKLMTGVIVACGTGYVSENKNTVIPLEIAPGDIVLFNDWAMSKPIEVDGEILYVMEEADMHGVIGQQQEKENKNGD